MSNQRKPRPTVYPKLAERLRALLPSHSAQQLSVISTGSNAESRGTEIFVDGSHIEIVASEGEWNLSTDEDFVYEWRSGLKEGIRFPRNNEDLVMYVFYLTDPSWIMAGLYFQYFEEPSTALVESVPLQRYTKLTFQKPISGFESLFISERPFWFHGFDFSLEQDKASFRVSKPEKIGSIPDEVETRRNEISFKDSDLTLQRHLSFL